MTLRSLISFDHVGMSSAYSLTVQGSYGAANPLNTVWGQPGAMMSGNSSNPPAVLAAANNNWLSLSSSNSSVYACYVVSFADLGWLQNGATQGWLGVRTYASGPGSGNAVGLMSTAGVGSSMANVNTILTEAQLARQVYSQAGAQYIEIFLDIAANTYISYVNGIQVGSGSFPAGQQYVVFGGIYSGSAGQQFRDFYFLDVDGTKPNGRLGPITSTPLAPTVSGVQAPNYGNYIGTINGAATISNAQVKFGASALAIGSAANQGVSFPDNAQYRAITGDYTYEGWFYNTNLSQQTALFSKDTGASPYAELVFRAGNWNVYFDGTPSQITVASNMLVNTWYHIALVRYQGVWTLYQNGVALGTFTGGTFGNNVNNFVVGNNGALNSAWQGYIDEFRISNIARYTGAFTPPVGPFTTDTNTMLLLHMDSSVVNGSAYVADSSGNTVTALQTAYGASPAITPFIQNGADNQPMTINFAPSVPAGQKVLAMQYKFAAQVPFAMNMLASLQEGATNKALPTYQFRDTIAQYARDMAGIQTTAPDGNGWNSTNISATNLVLQPQSTTAANSN